LASIAGTLFRLGLDTRGLRINWLMVGIALFPSVRISFFAKDAANQNGAR
jgi:hypothetical protein